MVQSQATEKAENRREPFLEPATRILALVSAALGILVVTLFPVRRGLLAHLRAGAWPSWSPADIFTGTLYTGPADVLLNVALFLPLGFFSVGSPTRPVRRVALAAGAGAMLSIAIEFLQPLVPGRYPSLVDVLSNGLGAGLGAWLALVLGTRAARASRAGDSI